MDISDETRGKVRALGTAIILMIAGVGLGIALTFVAGLFLSLIGIELTPVVLLVVWLVMVQGVAFATVAVGYLRYRDLPPSFVPVRVPSLREAGWIVGGYVLAFVAIFASSIVVSLTVGEVDARNNAAQVAIDNPEAILILIPAAFLLIGPGEELLFRGIIQGTLRERFSAPAAIVLASGIFAGLHFIALSGSTTGRLIAVSILFLPATVFGTAYEMTNNIVVPSLIHGIYNATLFGLLYVAIEYGSELQESTQAILSFL